MLAALTILVHLLAIHAVTGAMSGDEFSCHRFSDVYLRFKDCLREDDVLDFRRIINNMLQSDGVIKGDEILTELTQVCSNRETAEKIDSCVERIVTDCPTLEEIIHDTVGNKISFFCENDNPSSMISEVLQHDYMYNVDCSSEENQVYEIFWECAQEAYSESEGIDVWNGPVSDALSIYTQIREVWFQCTLQEERNEDQSVLACGATWQDTLIYFWISISGHGYLTPTLTASNVAELKHIKVY
ncbi:uncharacterized protein LOC123564695 [Mercenaria mercenaria]|uniref:uncharacterized protein LOC123564695 n=1 Tax=Mercenaria mercenaria TaxID=6596 RepID=UPI00234E4E49|nr:uncharacterized protein LOC123564695 [Mercenaria mercenaria]